MIGRELVKGYIHKFHALTRRDSLTYDGSTLPPKRLRFCGGEFKDDSYFLNSATKEAERLVKTCGLNRNSSVLDVGCGPGRLPIGILRYMGEIRRYDGLDPDRNSIDWGKRHISKHHTMFRFSHLDVRNLRYNPNGHVVIDGSFRFPFENGEFDTIYLYSVFSHMPEQEVIAYLNELKRLLKPNGQLFLTGFFERHVENVTVNPNGYRKDWNGDLHCVRYNEEHFTDLLARSGLHVRGLEYQTETDGQSALYAVHLKGK